LTPPVHIFTMPAMTDDGRVERRIPALAWVLVAAAAAQLGIWTAVNWYRVFGPYLILRIEDLSSIVTGVAPFLLAAAVLIGAPRWPAGGRWLYAGAALSAVHGVMKAFGDAWWAWRASDPVAPEGALQVALVVANLVAVAAAALGPLCLAAGLARVESVRRAPPIAVGLVVVVGLAAATAGLGLGIREIAWAFEMQSYEGAFIVVGVTYRLLITLGAVALAVLALVALRVLPRAGVVPEALIVIGATLAAAGLAVTWAGQALLSFESQDQFWVFALPWTVESIGMVLLIAGFAAAALGRRAPVPQPIDGRRASTETVAG
jgi:hypothetical protein